MVRYRGSCVVKGELATDVDARCGLWHRLDADWGLRNQ